MNQPIVKIEHGKAMTTSVAVADYFERQHKDVLDSIRGIIKEVPSDFTERNFSPSEYTDKSGRKLPCYMLTRSGFAMTALGFTGKKAIQFRLAYVQRFDEMEAHLREQERSKLADKYVRERYLPFDEDVIRPYVTASEACLHLRILGVHKTLTPGQLKGMLKRGELEGLQNERGHWCIYEDQVTKLATGH